MNLKPLPTINHCLRHLTTAVSTAKLYSAEHLQVKKLCLLAHSSLQKAMSGQESLALMRVDEQLAINEQPLGRSLYVNRFARLLKANGIGHITFRKDVSVEELLTLVSSVISSKKVVRSTENLRLGQVEVRYRSTGQKHVEGQQTQVTNLGKEAQGSPDSGDEKDQNIVFTLPLQAPENKSLLDSGQLLDDLGSEELARIREVYGAVKNNRKLQVAGLSEIVVSFIDLFAGYTDPLLTLVPMRNMDEYTFTHSLNVCLLNLAQATALGIEGQLLHDIGLSAMLHDVGKLFIPKEVLHKPGKLDEKEWALMQKHPVLGAEYLLGNPGVPRLAVVNAYEHHLRFDLQGYPKVDDNWQQNLCSQLTTISDIFDSLSTNRPYRDPLKRETVLVYVEELKGSQLHPLLVENFLRLMKKVPTAQNN